jgi:hypothetical protein
LYRTMKLLISRLMAVHAMAPMNARSWLGITTAVNVSTCKTQHTVRAAEPGRQHQLHVTSKHDTKHAMQYKVQYWRHGTFT